MTRVVSYLLRIVHLNAKKIEAAEQLLKLELSDLIHWRD